jgi:hypothetical protein
MLGHVHGLTTTTSCRQDKRAESLCPLFKKRARRRNLPLSRIAHRINPTAIPRRALTSMEAIGSRLRAPISPRTLSSS